MAHNPERIGTPFKRKLEVGVAAGVATFFLKKDLKESVATALVVPILWETADAGRRIAAKESRPTDWAFLALIGGPTAFLVARDLIHMTQENGGVKTTTQEATTRVADGFKGLTKRTREFVSTEMGATRDLIAESAQKVGNAAAHARDRVLRRPVANQS